MEFIFDIILDVVFELYDDLLTILMPNREVSRKTRILSRILCVIVSLINVALLCVGVYYLIKSKLALGLIFTMFGGILILAHIILAIIIKIKTSRR